MAPSPFIAALLIIVFLSRGLNEVAESSGGISLFFSFVWAIYLLLLGHTETSRPLAIMISALLQIPLMYAYLEVANVFEDSYGMFFYVFFLIVGAVLLAFFSSLIAVVLS